MGLGNDTHTSPSQFSDLALAFYVSYLVSEPLAGYLLQQLPVAKFLGGNGDRLEPNTNKDADLLCSDLVGSMRIPELCLQELCIPGHFESPSGCV
jgi:hypothetical protein